MKRILSLALLLSLILGGCSSTGSNGETPEDVYKSAEEDIEADRYQMALKKLRKLKNKFPYSRLSVVAKLRMADVYFLQENYVEAAAAYESFIELHPKNDKVPYAAYRVGESNFESIPSKAARDLTPATHALESFEDFLEKYGSKDEKLAQEARKKIKEIRDKLAEKQLYVGDYYRSWEFPKSAIKRYNHLMDKYPDSKHLTEAKNGLQAAEADLKALSPEEREEMRPHYDDPKPEQ